MHCRGGRETTGKIVCCFLLDSICGVLCSYRYTITAAADLLHSDARMSITTPSK